MEDAQFNEVAVEFGTGMGPQTFTEWKPNIAENCISFSGHDHNKNQERKDASRTTLFYSSQTRTAEASNVDPVFLCKSPLLYRVLEKFGKTLKKQKVLTFYGPVTHQPRSVKFGIHICSEHSLRGSWH